MKGQRVTGLVSIKESRRQRRVYRYRGREIIEGRQKQRILIELRSTSGVLVLLRLSRCPLTSSSCPRTRI